MMMSTTTQPRAEYKPESLFFPVTIIAKMIRLVLKKQYPTLKFSVTSEKFSMGSSVTFKLKTEGMVAGAPSRKALNQIAKLFSTRGFDGMTDSTTYEGFTVDGLKIHLDSWVHASAPDYAIARENADLGMDLTDEEFAAVVAHRDALIREFKAAGRLY